MLCSSLSHSLHVYIRNYDRLQYLAVILIYIQIGCALIGSLGAFYNGVLLTDLAISLFALVAIESGNQTLGRTYAALLASAILLDAIWFIFFSYDIWNISSAKYGVYAIFSIRLTLSMQIIGCKVRALSSFLWIQMYRLGRFYLDRTVSRGTDADSRVSFLNPTTPVNIREPEDGLGGAIYDPAYYSSLFEDGRDNGNSLVDKFAPNKPPTL